MNNPVNPGFFNKDMDNAKIPKRFYPIPYHKQRSK